MFFASSSAADTLRLFKTPRIRSASSLRPLPLRLSIISIVAIALSTSLPEVNFNFDATISLALPCSFSSKPCGESATLFLLPLPPVAPRIDSLFSARTVSAFFNSLASLDFCSLVFSLVELSSIINSISSSDVSKSLISTLTSFHPSSIQALRLLCPARITPLEVTVNV